MTAQPWPESPEFRRFAAKIADGCMLQRSAGWKIRPPDSNAHAAYVCCPLGAAMALLYPFTGKPYPPPGAAASQLGAPPSYCFDFACAFDSGVGDNSPVSRLGLAYRARFAGEGRKS